MKKKPLLKKVSNSKGKIYYGMHFYPGVAEYQEPGKDPYRVFLNEDTIRSMDPSFAGRPVFVIHVDEVESNIDELRKEADGWVVESFYNAADGKHWVKFIVVSKKGEQAIKAGMRLSNAYIPLALKNGGHWNGVSYAKEITSGEYEHLAIVSNPRYEESIILSPEEFKEYNAGKMIELKRLANSKNEKGERKVSKKLNFFKRKKVENAIDPELSVILPKSKREVTLTQLVAEADAASTKKNSGVDLDAKLKLGDGTVLTVRELAKKFVNAQKELEALQSEEDESEEDTVTNAGDEEDEDDMSAEDMESDEESEADEEAEEESEAEGDAVQNSDDDDESMENEDDEAAKITEVEDEEVEDAKAKNKSKKNKMKKKKNKLKKKNELEVARQRAKAAKLRTVHITNADGDAAETAVVEFGADRVARGKAKYGS